MNKECFKEQKAFKFAKNEFMGDPRNINRRQKFLNFGAHSRDEKKYECPEKNCKIKSTSYISVAKHVKRHHPELNNKE